MTICSFIDDSKAIKGLYRLYRHLVVDNYLLSTAKSTTKNVMGETSCPQLNAKVLIVDN